MTDEERKRQANKLRRELARMGKIRRYVTKAQLKNLKRAEKKP